mmetsp:Transcript_99676/g.260474  ORF Transcript_99676/g.260474 Transcript_99676/m.260474 type:complete len:81 (-) Transcript_99676:131-373(-)
MPDALQQRRPRLRKKVVGTKAAATNKKTALPHLGTLRLAPASQMLPPRLPAERNVGLLPTEMLDCTTARPEPTAKAVKPA